MLDLPTSRVVTAASGTRNAERGTDWTLLLDDARPGWMNMALDRALLDLADREGRSFLRLYRWDPHCLSFGRNEPARRRYDRARIAALGLDLVRRPTGGRAVWHARELTYAVAAPIDRFGTLAASYRIIHQMLARAVGLLGAEVALAPAPVEAAGVGIGACFGSAAGGEVLVAGRKVVGSAQLRQGNGFLQHGSLLLGDDQSLVREVTHAPAAPGQEAPLANLLRRAVRFEEAAQAVAAAAREWGGTWHSRESPTELFDQVREHEAQFRSTEWTWRR